MDTSFQAELHFIDESVSGWLQGHTGVWDQYLSETWSQFLQLAPNSQSPSNLFYFLRWILHVKSVRNGISAVLPTSSSVRACVGVRNVRLVWTLQLCDVFLHLRPRWKKESFALSCLQSSSSSSSLPDPSFPSHSAAIFISSAACVCVFVFGFRFFISIILPSHTHTHSRTPLGDCFAGHQCQRKSDSRNKEPMSDAIAFSHHLSFICRLLLLPPSQPFVLQPLQWFSGLNPSLRRREAQMCRNEHCWVTANSVDLIQTLGRWSLMMGIGVNSSIPRQI